MMSIPGIRLIPITTSLQGHGGKDYPREGLTLLGLSHSFPLSLPIEKDSRWSGSALYGFRLWSIACGMSSVLLTWTAWWLCSFVVNDWMYMAYVELKIISDNCIRLYKTARYISYFNGSSNWHFYNCVFWLSWLAFLHYCVPVQWRYTIDVAFKPGFLSIVAATIQYILSDAPLGWQILSLYAQCDIALGHIVLSWLLFDATRILGWARWTVLWLTDLIVYETNYQQGSNWLITMHWERLKKDHRTTTEVTLLVAFALVPLVVYAILRRIPAGTTARLLETSAPGRWLYAMTVQAMSMLDLFDALGAVVYKATQNHFQRVCIETSASKEREPYQYTRLKDKHIRLLMLQKSPYGNGFVAELVDMPLTDDLQYEALSYCWGSSELTHNIVVSGKSLQVTESAFKLLVSRMSFFHNRLLWLDAICINQQDTIEKATQVPMMAEIYRRATRVLVVPDHHADNRMAANLLYELGTAYTGASPAGLKGRGLVSPALALIDHFKIRWQALATLLRRPYFRRAWVVQEIAVGKDVQLLLGGIYVSWTVFHEAVFKLHTAEFGSLLASMSVQTGSNLGDPALSKIMCVNGLRADSINGLRAELLPYTQLAELAPLLALVSDFEATDGRDKVYAIAGMTAHFRLSQHLKVDYNKGLEEVYTDAARAVLLSPRPAVDMLAYAGVGWRRSVRVASWVPVLDTPVPWLPLTELFMAKRRFQAGGSSLAKVRQGQLDGYLEVEGCVCDTVLQLDETFNIPMDPETIHNDIYTTFGTLSAYIASTLASMELHRTLLGDNADLEAALAGDGLPGIKLPSNALVETIKLMRDFHTLYTLDDKAANTISEECILQLWSRQKKLQLYFLAITRTCAGRRIGITQAGRLCVVPPNTRKGDKICILVGAQTPYVIDNRDIKDGDGSEWQMVGECYVQGIMQGELLNSLHSTTTLTFL